LSHSPLAQVRPLISYAWRGPSNLIVDKRGAAGTEALTGYFFRQARFLRVLQLQINGEMPYPCSFAAVAPHELEFGYIHPEVEVGGGGGSGSGGLGRKGELLYRDIDLRLVYRIHPASLEATLRIANRWQERVQVELAWLLDADFATVDEAQFGVREQEAKVEVESLPGGARFHYLHPRLPFQTEVRGEGAEWHWEDGSLSTTVSLARQELRELRLVVRAIDPEDPISGEAESRRVRRVDEWTSAVSTAHADAETPLITITNDAMRDLGSLALLEGPEDEWLVPGAGVPLYQTLWGRDALTATWQAAILDRGEMLGDVLTRLTRTQGTRVDPSHDEQPGRIINQAKVDPLSRLGITPFARYYADYASPLVFVIGLGYHYALTGSKERLSRNWDAAKRVIEWARQHGDRDGDGYLEYLTASPHGPRHQGWKDSENAIVDEDGRQVEPPIAPCEIQGYYYAALQFMSALSFAMGERRNAVSLWREAARLKERFNRDFWMEDEGFLAFGLDADKRPIRALTSNAGQCIPTGIVDDEHIPRLARRLLEPDLFSGWGIRTLSTGNPAYNPLDYHLGSVWPVENATILLGLRRYGLNDEAVRLARALYELARLWPGGRTPECVGGYSRDEFAHPSAYPRANTPQTWNQSVFPLLVQCILGLVPYAPRHLLLVDPVLPTWLPEVELRSLRIGDAIVTIRFRRSENGKSEFDVLEKQGKLRVIRQPWIESTSATLMERLKALVAS
jgi:glycogen debranching enzyme